MKKTNAIRLLESNQIHFNIIEYTYDPERLSVEKIARDNQLELSSIYKTLVAKGDKTGVVVAVIPGSKNLNLKALSNVSGNKKMTLVPVKDLLSLTGYIRGGCSPIGMKKNYPVFFDLDAQSATHIYVNAGQRGVLFGAAPEDIRTLCEGAFAQITQ